MRWFTARSGARSTFANIAKARGIGRAIRSGATAVTQQRASHRSRRWIVVAVAAGVCSLLTACGGKTATQPESSVPLPLTAGRQLLTLGGFWISLDPSFPPCAPPGLPRDGTSVNTIVDLAREGGDWVARSAPAMGSLELRLRGTAPSARGYIVAGTISGTALDIGLMGVIRDVRVSLASSSSGGFATFDGETASPSSSFVAGKVTGTVRFSDSQGASSTCAAIQWTMQPL
jgi:hypothetical protein